MSVVEPTNWTEQLGQKFVQRAISNGRTVDEEIEFLLDKKSTYTPDERAAVSHYFLSRCRERQPSLTLDEIREGLM